MYKINQRVWIKSLGTLGRVTEANMVTLGSRRTAHYVVTYGESFRANVSKGDILCGSKNLRAADKCCDGCGEWRPNNSFNGGERNRDVNICFLCVKLSEFDSRPMTQEDIDYERAQHSEAWERMGGGGL